MTNDQVLGVVVAWVQAVTGAMTIYAYQSGPEPVGKHVVVNLTGFAALQEHEQDVEYADEGDDVRATPVMDMEWRFSLHAYGADPTDTLRPLKSAEKLTQVMEPLFPSLVIHESSEIRHVPDWVNAAWRPRAQMDLIVHGVVRDGRLIDVIEEANFNFERRA